MKTYQELLYEHEKERGNEVYLRQALNWEWRDFTWKEVMTEARKVASFLKSLGLKEGDRVSILSKNCAEWFIVDFGIMLAGMVNAPLFATLHKDKLRYILDHSEAKVIFLGRLDNAQYLKQGFPEHLITVEMGYYLDIDVDYYWKDILDKFEPSTENFIPNMTDLATIIYTSGTTGNPKGVMITYQIWASLAEIINNQRDPGLLPSTRYNRLISYLPLAHIAERVIVQYYSVCTNDHFCVSFIDTVETFIENLRDTQPTYFFGVPRIWVQLQFAILNRLEQKKLDLILKIPILRTLFKRRLKRALGLNKSIFYFVGAAPIAPSVLLWWKKLGIELSQGYGMTESSGLGCLNFVGNSKIGTVGKPWLGLDIKIAHNGELLIKGPVLMAGYYKDTQATEETFTKDGYLKTGDKAEMDNEGFISIIGRVKDTFKTDKGEFVDPVPIETAFESNEFIEQLCLLGLNLVQPVLVIQLGEKAKNESRQVVENSLLDTLENINLQLPRWEKISHIYITHDEWTPENEMLTATLKIKRNKIAELYTDRIKQRMNKQKMVIWE